MVWGLRACEFVVTNKSCLLTCVSDTQRGGIKFSTVSPVQEIVVVLWGTESQLYDTVGMVMGIDNGELLISRYEY